MQIDMHFYGTYALARAAGLPPEVARIVATAAQFVDDAVDREPVSLGGESFLLPLVSAHPMIDKGNVEVADQWQVWLPFHFLPGAVGGPAEERLLCRKGEPGNPSADAVLKLAADRLLEPYGWYLLGVVSHVIQDTFSHWGFSGISSAYNHVEQGDIELDPSQDANLLDQIAADAGSLWDRFTGSLAEDFSALGHGSVATYPDRPFLKWEFDYEMSLASCPRLDKTTHIVRDNPADFLLACERLFGLYNEAARSRFGAAARQFSDISGPVLDIIKVEARQPGRISAWKNAITTGVLFTAVAEDSDLGYDEDCWAPGSLRTKPKAQKLEAQLFFKASRNYRCFVLGQLLPSLSLL